MILVGRGFNFEAANVFMKVILRNGLYLQHARLY